VPLDPTVLSGARERLRRVDPLIVICGVAALTVYVVQGFGASLSRDLGVYSYGGQQVAEGVPPYVAILNRVGPLAHLVPGIGVVVGRSIGIDDVLAMRVTLMLVSVVAIMVVYLLGRDLFSSRMAGLVSAAALLSCEGFLRYATFGPREKTTMVCFLALALLAMVHQRWGTAGAMTALSTLTWQPVIVPAIAGLAVAAVLGTEGGRGRLVALARIAVGGLIPTAVTVIAYAAIGRLQMFLDAFVWINLRYTTVGGAGPGDAWASLTRGYGWSMGVMILGTLVVLALGIQAARRPTRTTSQGASLVGLGTFVVVCLAWSTRSFDSWPDAFFLLPVAAIGTGGLVTQLSRRLTLRAVTAVTVAWCLLATALALVSAIGSRSDVLDTQRADAEMVMSALPAKSRIVSIKAPQALVFTHQRNPSRLQLFSKGLGQYVDDTWPGGIEGYARWIAKRSPTVIAVGYDKKRACCPSWIEDVLREDYKRVGASSGPYKWYVNKRIPHRIRSDIHAMLHAG
jgi:hypothetical protein